MSILFQLSAGMRATFRAIAWASGALALFFDDEDETWELCGPLTHRVPRPDSEPYELEDPWKVHVDAYYGAACR